MANPNISHVISDADKATIAAIPASILAILTFLVNLTPEQRRNLRKMATKRTGYVEAVFLATMTNQSAIPGLFPIDEYKKDKELYDDLKYFLEIFRPVIEAIDDTILMMGNELMTQSDTCYAYLKNAAQGNAALTETVANIATAFKSNASKSAQIFMLPPAGSVVVSNVITETPLVNNGTTIIQFKASSNIATKPATEWQKIEPGNSEIIPKGYTVVSVENISTSDAGSFSVRTK